MPSIPYLCPASSWSTTKGLRRLILPAQVKEVAADCGGFVATRIWGDYRYTPREYYDWLSSWKVLPTWAATMDYCCEPPIASSRQIILDRQKRTTENALYFWQHFKSAPWVWVPTIQGWDVSDYINHATELKPLIQEMQAYYGPNSEFRVGLGTLCARADAKMIASVVQGVNSVLDSPLHLWGVKLAVLKAKTHLNNVISVDSAAWNGLIKSDKQKQKDSGMSQAEYGYKVALPDYLQKFDIATKEPKQTAFNWF